MVTGTTKLSCFERPGGLEILLCYECDTKLSTMHAMSNAMELIHNRSACSCPASHSDHTASSSYPIPGIYANSELSSAEKARISHSVSDLQHLLDRHEFELSRLQDVITFLSTSREELTRRMEDVKSLVAPINTLPDEILAEILRMHFLGEMEEVRYRSYGKIRIPLGFTGVCKKWRTVAFDSPRIWADITAFGEMHVPADEETFVHNTMKMFLSRSRYASLKVKLGLSTSGHHTKSTNRVVTPLLLAQSSRWGEADIDIDLGEVDLPPGDDNRISAVPGLHGKFPMLRRLAVGGQFASPSQRWRWDDPLNLETQLSPAISLDHAPLLAHLTLNLCHVLSIAEMARAISLPWRQIQTLRCNYSFGNLESLLQLCINVEEVEVSAVFRVFRSDTGPATGISEGPYTCPSLKRMSLNVSPTCEGVRDLLKNLRAPGLTSLHLTFISSDYPPSKANLNSISKLLAEDLVSFFTHSRCSNQLTELVLHDVPRFNHCAETLIQLFGNTPRLEKLELEFKKVLQSDSQEYPGEYSDSEDPDPPDQDLCSLTNLFYELRRTSFLPALTHLRLSLLDMSSYSNLSSNTHTVCRLERKALFDMLEARRQEGIASPIVTKLKNVYLDEDSVYLVF